MHTTRIDKYGGGVILYIIIIYTIKQINHLVYSIIIVMQMMLKSKASMQALSRLPKASIQSQSRLPKASMQSQSQLPKALM